MIRIAFCSVVSLAIAFSAQAATIVSYNLQGAPGNQASQAPAISAAFTTGVNLTRGAGVAASAASNSFSANGWESATAAPTSTEYFEFGFNVDAGYFVDVAELYIGTRSSGTGPGTIGIYTSIDSYASPVATIVQGNATFVNTIVDLSSLGNVSGNVRFRIYEIGNTQADGDGATASTGTFRVTAYFANGAFDRDFQITGTVNAIPEASSMMLAFVGIVVAGASVRTVRRSKNA